MGRRNALAFVLLALVWGSSFPAAGWLVLAEGIESTTVLGFVVVLAGFALVKRRALRSLLHRYGGEGVAKPTRQDD